MRKGWTQIPTQCVPVASLLCHVSCSRSFAVVPNGRIDETVTFSFYELTNGMRPSKFTIVDFEVRQQSGTDWVLVWKLEGKEELSEISYGSQYKGLRETQPAKQLESTGTYRVAATAKQRVGPIGHAVAYFSFREDGVPAVNHPGVIGGSIPRGRQAGSGPRHSFGAA